jgi:hypothetical protein
VSKKEARQTRREARQTRREALEARRKALEARRKALADSRDSRRIGWRPFRWTLAIAVAVSVAAVRWMTAAHLDIGQWAAGAPTTPGSYIFIIIAIVLLIAPDADSIAFPGVKVELRRAREDIEGLRLQVQQVQNQRQEAKASASASPVIANISSPEAAAALVAALIASSKETLSEERRRADVPSSAVAGFLKPRAAPGVDH